MANEYWSKDELVSNLWKQYSKTRDFQSFSSEPLAILKNHPIVREREERGLKSILLELRKSLSKKTIYLKVLQERKPADWIAEWKRFHNLLFRDVLKERGNFREIDVRFGSPEDEEIYSVPQHQEVIVRIGYFADEVCHKMKKKHLQFDDYLDTMASIHHDFICLHPFSDGNGRIGRAIIDQLSLAFGFPMVMGGYPRTNIEQRRIYHKAIKEASLGDEYSLLKQWIQAKIERNLGKL